MSNEINFSEFSRQSLKGVLIISGKFLFQLLKGTWVVFLVFITKASKISSIDAIYFYAMIVLLLLFVVIRSYLVYRNFKFKIDGDYFVLKNGIIAKKNTAIAFDRIQNVNFSQNLIHQLINVYQVDLETAGSDKTEISIKALSLSDAKALRQKITSGRSIGNEEIVVEETEKEKPLLTIDVKSLLKVSISENHFQSLLLLIAFLFGFYQQVEDVFKNFIGEEILKNYLSKGKDILLGSFLLLIIVLILLSIVAVITSFIRVFLRHFNLSFSIKNQAFEIKQGLVNKKAIILKRDKVQHIKITTNPLKRMMGISYVVFKQAISGKVKKTDKQIKIVGCKEEHLDKIKTTLFSSFDFNDVLKEKPHWYFTYRIILRNFLFLAFFNTFHYFIFDGINQIYLNLLLIPILGLMIFKRVKKTFFKATDKLILVGGGIIETSETYLELFKVQNVKMKQTIFQRRRKITDIILQTASGKIKIPSITMERANELYNHILYKVETSTKEWM
ncbi:PH domain-containing protein [Tenacibaculum sp. ZS6-P6]|uniref:PH domain-containing protein n=1 Tax=Tenacibaculum sp. ZS6-P6 TaxID=3447503 RepID=UPI003F9BAAA7